MRRYTVSALRLNLRSMLSASAILLLTLSCSVQPRAELAAYGDSVTWGYGDLPGGWVRRVEQGSGYAVANLGVPGEKANAADQRADAALRTVPLAKVVFLLHGGNDWVHIFSTTDCLRTCDPATVDRKYEDIADHLRSIRSTIVKRGKKAVFLTYWPNSRAKCDNYSDEGFAVFQAHRIYLDNKIIAVAAEHGDKVIDMREMQDFGADADFFDCLHPSAQGYKKIAGKILEEVGDWAPPDPEPKDLLKGGPIRW